jgi:hypothetical protein
MNTGYQSGWTGQQGMGACGPREYVETDDERLARDLETALRIEQARRELLALGYSLRQALTGKTNED